MFIIRSAVRTSWIHIYRYYCCKLFAVLLYHMGGWVDFELLLVLLYVLL